MVEAGWSLADVLLSLCVPVGLGVVAMLLLRGRQRGGSVAAIGTRALTSPVPERP